MKVKVLFYFVLSIIILSFSWSCGEDKKLSLQELKVGTFGIEGDDDITIVRENNLQLEKYKATTQIDSFAITWKNDSIYILKAVHPKTVIDTDVITYKIKNIDTNGYEFESTIGDSNYIQKGRIYKK